MFARVGVRTRQEIIFLDGHHARRTWFDMEVNLLREDIARLELEGGGTGSKDADKLIFDWCRAALPAGFAI